MSKTRFALIGLKGIGRTHLQAVRDVEAATLAAVCDCVEDIARAMGEEENVPWYTDYHKMLDRDDIDVVCIGTPHYLHCPMTVAALDAGKHVLCEKPMAMTVGECDLMIAHANRANRKLGIFHQRRTTPRSILTKRLIDEHRLGRVVRICCMACAMRTQAYFDSDAWRGTWAQEGGGVLINQTVHDIDYMLWLTGDTCDGIEKLSGQIGTYAHQIEVEDQASAVFSMRNGAQGVFQASLCESPGSHHFEIAGDRATLIEDGNVKLATPEQSVSEFIKATPEVWGKLPVEWETLEIPPLPSGHSVLVRDMIDAIGDDRPHIVSGEQAIRAIEFLNAIILSSYTGKSVSFPLDREEYRTFFDKLSKS